MNYFKPLLAIALVIFAASRLFTGGAIARPPGELAPDEPEQTLIEHAAQIRQGDFLLLPRARYNIEARVLSVERYRVGTEAQLSPIDYAVGWGIMSDTDTLNHFRLSQGGRFFSIHPDEHAIALNVAMLHASNMHLIPADSHVENTILSARPGNVAVLNGYLVNVSRNDGFTWNSSLSREDSGAGACELMYVQSATLR